MTTYLIKNEDSFEFKTTKEIIKDLIYILGESEFERLYQDCYETDLTFMYEDQHLNDEGDFKECFYLTNKDIQNYRLEKEKDFYRVRNTKNNKEYNLYSNTIVGKNIPKFIFDIQRLIKERIKLKNYFLGKEIIDNI